MLNKKTSMAMMEILPSKVLCSHQCVEQNSKTI